MSVGPVYRGQLFVVVVSYPIIKGIRYSIITVEIPYMIIEVINIYIIAQLC